MSRVLVVALTVLLPLTACLVFAAGEVLVPHPWTKHADGVAHAAVKLPSGVATATTTLLPLIPLARLASPVSPLAASITRKPPFVPPRA